MAISPQGASVEWIQPGDQPWLQDSTVPSELAERILEGFRLAVWRPSPGEYPLAWVAVTIQPGGVGFLDPPGAIGDLTLVQAQSLLSFVVAQLGTGVNLMQLMLPKGAEIAETASGAAGFQFGAQLLLLGRECSFSEIEPLPPALRFEPCGDELSQVLALTYEATKDCPLLTGRRPLEEVIKGYEATGASARKHWKTLFCEDRPVGCVLAAVHNQLEIAELVYMGLISEVRGKGLGAALLMEAERMTLEIGLSRLVIGVDADNVPARRVYEDSGYSVWEQKRVLLWFPKAARQDVAGT